MCHEAILHARTMGIPCCFTDHSLFGFADTSSILTNKLLKFTLSDVGNAICVSHTSKENTVLRAALDPLNVHVIPNAIDSAMFRPQLAAGDGSGGHPITVVVMSRLVHRKGVDLLTAVVPRLCAASRLVHFLIAGDGPKKIDLEQMRERHGLCDRVTLVGMVGKDKVRDYLVRGHIFLNCSLTEAFCMAIVEAASCGLHVVSTQVGGVPEVLPADMLHLSVPHEDHLFDLMIKVIDRCHHELRTMSRRDICLHKWRQHERVARMYGWGDVAERTERVYLRALSMDQSTPLVERMKRVYGMGETAGKLFIFVLIIDYILIYVLEAIYA